MHSLRFDMPDWPEAASREGVVTCIVGIEDRVSGTVLLGADSYSSDYTVSQSRSGADTKVFRIGPYVVGFSTSWRMGQILRYHVTLPDPPKRGALHRHMVTAVVPVIREAFKAHGWLTANSSEPNRDVGGAFLVGVRGMLFEIASDFQVGHVADGYNAIGCAYHVALGALYANAGAAPRARARLALEAAVAHGTHVKPPFRFLETRPYDRHVPDAMDP